MELFILSWLMISFKWIYIISFAMNMFYRAYYADGIRFMFEETYLGSEGGAFMWMVIGMIPIMNTVLGFYVTYVLYIRNETDT